MNKLKRIALSAFMSFCLVASPFVLIAAIVGAVMYPLWALGIFTFAVFTYYWHDAYEWLGEDQS